MLYLVWYLRDSDVAEGWEVDWLNRSVQLAKLRPIWLAPVSQAWLRARAARINLYERDGNHANSAGAYLAACVLYGVMYGKSAEGTALPPSVALEPKLALRLQTWAWEEVLKLRR